MPVGPVSGAVSTRIAPLTPPSPHAENPQRNCGVGRGRALSRSGFDWVPRMGWTQRPGSSTSLFEAASDSALTMKPAATNPKAPVTNAAVP
jgi:hypothetical protein